MANSAGPPTPLPLVSSLSLPNLALLAAVVFGVNVMPAFGPPTWAVLVFFRLRFDVPAVPLVLLGALSSAAGRLVLASASRGVGGHVSEHRRRSIDALREELQTSRRSAWAGLGLFLLSPLPSAQLFVAAGLLRVALLPLTAAFLAGRLLTYSLYVGAASAAKASLGSAFASAFTSPWAIALQVVMLGGLVALMRVDWAALIERRRSRRPGHTVTKRPAAPERRPSVAHSSHRAPYRTAPRSVDFPDDRGSRSAYGRGPTPKGDPCHVSQRDSRRERRRQRP